MTQREKLLKLVRRNPGLTATAYAKLLGNYNRYKPATILKELHKFSKDGELYEYKGLSMTKDMQAWRFTNPKY